MLEPTKTPANSYAECLERHRADFEKATRRVFTPPERLHVDEWAAKHRVLPSKGAAMGGRWRNEVMPHLVEIMRCLTDPKVRSVTFMASSQVGKTEVGLNWVGCTIQCRPRSFLWVTGVEDSVRDLSRQRLDPMLDTRPFRGLVAKKKGRSADRTTKSITYEGGFIKLASCNSPSALASNPIPYIVFDEVDRYKRSSQDEGDAITLGTARQKTFERFGAKTLYISSPDIEGESRITEKFYEGDQRHRHVPCHACGVKQKLVFEQIDFGKHGRGGTPARPLYACAHCPAAWTDQERWAALGLGEWIAEKPFEGHASFFVNTIYSSLVPLVSIVSDWLAAQGSNEKLQSFLNTVLGIPWSVIADAYDPSAMHLETWEGDFPITGCMLVAFADVQADRFEVSTFAVGAEETMYGVDHRIIHGATDQPATWKALEDHLARRWTRDDGRVFGLTAFGIDCGYEMDRVCRWAKGFRGVPRVFAIKGVGRGLSERVVTDRRASKTNTNLRFFNANVDAAKYGVLTKLKTEAGAGRMRFPNRECFTPAYFEQLAAEKLQVRHVRGQPKHEWKKAPGARNEAFDCAAGCISVLRWLDPNLDAIAAKVPPIEGGTPKPRPAPQDKEAGPKQPEKPAPIAARPKIRVTIRRDDF